MAARCGAFTGGFPVYAGAPALLRECLGRWECDVQGDKLEGLNF